MEDQPIDVRDYPELALLCWNRSDHLISRADAFRLYEREWRLIDPSRMSAHERELLRDLTDKFGEGVINARGVAPPPFRRPRHRLVREVLERFSDEEVRRRTLAALAIDDEATLDAGLARLSPLVAG